ncbi:RNA methylase family UPF0020 protein [Besnoitia besnoiti]|uniref:RNA methylase family UPF0020 protein n=1 Tax=Besnoitia besnoiti TaxID=94643 RepID=A0A2A9M1N7_BESBE|nr:RNA methylase family UPF0020 protein [Besnoitia besnoiti]PFH31879.1 RNA methylase family UPF0020 protein [Besnoitia besnoiti]
MCSATPNLNHNACADPELPSGGEHLSLKTKRARRRSKALAKEDCDIAASDSGAAERAFAMLRARLSGHQNTNAERSEDKEDGRHPFHGCVTGGETSSSSSGGLPPESLHSSHRAADAADSNSADCEVSASPAGDSSEEEDESLLQIFCVCAPGLEGLLTRELLSLRLPPPSLPATAFVPSGDFRADEKARLQEAAMAAAAAAADAANRIVVNGPVDGKYRGSGGGVEVTGTLETLWNICMRSRLTDAVRVRVGSAFPAQREATLLRRLCALPWQKFVPLVAELGEPAVSVRVRRSRLHHTKMIADMTAAAVKENKKTFMQQTKRDTLPPHLRGRGVTMAGPHLLVNMRDGVCQVSIDAGGDVGRRPWRVSRGPMPLKEPLAAAVAYRTPFLNMLYERSRLFVWDPFCGTGPILLEMLGIAAGLPANSPRRRHAFFDFPIHSPSRFAAFLDCISLSPHPNVQNLELFGSDIDPDQVERARKNVEAFRERLPRPTDCLVQEDREAELPCKINFTEGSFLQVSSTIPPGALIVTNLPYGRRSDKNNIEGIYRDFRRMVAARDDWAAVYVLSASKKFRAEGSLNWRAISRFSNGGIEVELLKYTGKKSNPGVVRAG